MTVYKNSELRKESEGWRQQCESYVCALLNEKNLK
jgi:hypothetical protein